MSEQSHASLKGDLFTGFRGRCPRCGRGHMFRAFLKVAERCDVCGEEFFHHRADDLPAYLVIVFVGHVVVALLLYAEALRLFGYWSELAVFGALTLTMSLSLLQPVKGAVVALQWHLGLHGFPGARESRRCSG